MLDVQRARAVIVISIFAVGPARVPRWVRWMEHPGCAAGAVICDSSCNCMLCKFGVHMNQHSVFSVIHDYRTILDSHPMDTLANAQ